MPKFIRGLDDVRVVENENASFECEVNKPHFKVSWFTKGKRILPSNKYKIIHVDSKHKLGIDKVQLDEEGQVTAVVDDVKTTANLQVEGNNYVT